MGYGAWNLKDFTEYSKKMSREVTKDGKLAGTYSNQEIFKVRELDRTLNPFGVTRECRDSEDHPETLPVILALDVTGSMGQAAVEVARQLNVIMTKLYDQIKDVEFMIMGIGDFAYDAYPLQVSQFEADIRIAEQLDRLYFEFVGGGNLYESYTAAWYFALHHTQLDAWDRGKKGIIITMGDERLNPYIPKSGRKTSMEKVFGDHTQGDVETRDLYQEISEKYEVFHLDVDHRRRSDEKNIRESWRKYLDGTHFRSVTIDSIADEIVDIIVHADQGTGEHRRDLKNVLKEIFW